jgi:hypothetical protein
MKNIFIGIYILILASCKNDYSKSKTTISPDAPTIAEIDTGNKTNTENEENDFNSNKDSSIIFVGVFAQWKYSNTEYYDGSYDTTNNLFVLCSSDACKEVSRSQIIFLPFGNCDTALTDRVKLFMKMNGEINPKGTRLEVVDDKGLIRLNEKTIRIEIGAEKLDQINKVKIYEMNQKKLIDKTNEIKIKTGDTAKLIKGIKIKNPEIYRKKNQ